MNYKSLYTFLSFIFIISIPVDAQNKYFNNWYFGDKAGINFNTSPPSPLSDGIMNTFEGSGTISDKNGNLLFYTDGDSVWNKNHLPMLNAYGLKGHSSSTQSCLITPYIGDTNKFFLFTADQEFNYDGLNYSIVDMGLDNGLGGIDSTYKNINLTDSISEKLCAAIHSNGYDYWIIVKRPLSSTFHSYLVTCDGIQTTPIISDAGGFYSEKGYMKASKDGKCIVSAELMSNGIVQLFDFNNSTGKITFREIISQTPSKYYYGVEFSPNDSLIYVSNNSSIQQYERYAGNVCSSEVTLSHTGFSAAAMQLAPDNKIYISLQNQHMLSVITDPDDLANPGLNIASFSLGAGNSRESITSFFLPFPMHQKNFEYKLNDTVVCPKNSFVVNAQLPDSFTYQWAPTNIFSDPASSSPEISISENTTAYITITDTYACRKADSTNITSDIDLCPITTIYIPTAFSPNNDGVNDIFLVRGAEIHNFNLDIYDRLGKLVFSSTDQSEAWSGDINGKKGNSAVYIYILNYKDIEGKSHYLKGNLSLIR